MSTQSFHQVEALLAAAGAQSALPLFQKHAIDDDVLPLVTEQTLRELGLPLGIQLRIWNELQRRNGKAHPASAAVATTTTTNRRRKNDKQSGDERSDHTESEADELEGLTKAKRRKPSTAARRARSGSRNPGFVKKWLPTILVVMLFGPPTVKVLYNVVGDVIEGITNPVFVGVAALLVVVAVATGAILQYFWNAHLEGTSPLQLVDRIFSLHPRLDF